MVKVRHPLISAQALMALREVTLLDCRAQLGNADAGAQAYAQGHIPGAFHADLETQLSGPKSPRGACEGGRHPLPHPDQWARTRSGWGIVDAQQWVVVYDDQGGLYAARAWWLLRWSGHSQVALLDGGLQAWQAAGGVMEQTAREHTPVAAALNTPWRAPCMPTVDQGALLRDVSQAGAARRWALIDARASERYRGECEPLDARAGHIPGAVNRFFQGNLDASGRFLPPSALRARFALWADDPTRAVHQCGSGVTACHNILAMEASGLHGSALYPGSWSEWSAGSCLPTAVGD